MGLTKSDLEGLKIGVTASFNDIVAVDDKKIDDSMISANADWDYDTEMRTINRANWLLPWIVSTRRVRIITTVLLAA